MNLPMDEGARGGMEELVVHVPVPLTLQVTFPKGTVTPAEKDIYATFAQYGEVNKVTVSPGAALVDFCSHNEALAAFRVFNDPSRVSSLPGTKVTLAPGEAVRLRLSPQAIATEAKLFVAPLHPEWDEEATKNFFGQFGSITEIVTLSKGGAFVKFESMDAAESCMEACRANPVQHPGTKRPMKAVFASARSDRIASPPLASGQAGSHSVNSRTEVASTYASGNLVQQVPHLLSQTTQGVAHILDTSQKGPMGANLFIHNHPFTWTKTDVENLFNPYGPLLSVNVQVDKATQRAKGYSFVSFRDPRSADMAIRDLNGATFGGKRLEVSLKKGETGAAPFARQMPPLERPFAAARAPNGRMPLMQPPVNHNRRQVHGAKLFVRVGSLCMSDEEFRRLFEPYGTIIECALQKDATGAPKNFGFVNYDSVVSAVQAIKALHNQALPGTNAEVLDVSIKKGEEGFAEPFMKMPMTKGPEGANLFVRRLPDQWTEDDLFMQFIRFGEILSVKINVDPKTGDKKGFGFVSFSAPNMAASAIEQMNGQLVEGKALDVSLKAPKGSHKVANGGN